MIVKIKQEPNNKKPLIVSCAAVVLMFLMLVYARSSVHFVWLEQAMLWVTTPFQSAVSAVTLHVNKTANTVNDILMVNEENKRLRTEVANYLQQQVKVNEVMAENRRLAALLNYKTTARQFDLMSARVIARDSNNWTASLVLNRGTADGVKNEMTVVNADGLIGSVVEASAHTSRVRLILDPRNAVAALVQRPDSRISGIVEGTANYDGIVKMINIPRDAVVDIEDKIITSGFGGIYPKGILVGTVTEVKNQDGGLLKYAVLKPAVNFRVLEDVMLITGVRELPAAETLGTSAVNPAQAKKDMVR